MHHTSTLSVLGLKQCLRNDKFLSHGALYHNMYVYDKCCISLLSVELRKYCFITCNHMSRVKIIFRFFVQRIFFTSLLAVERTTLLLHSDR